jgi:Zn-dependent protease
VSRSDLNAPSIFSPPPTVNNHIPLGQLFGIRIWLSRFVLWMIGALALFNALEDPSLFLPTVIAVVTVLGIVLLHELGHSLVAMRMGVKVSHITLWPLGGVAWMEQIPEDPLTEGLIAIAGPAVNFVLALLALPLIFVVQSEQAAFLVMSFIQINLALGAFNLMPAFPMDGGRLLRAMLALKMEWLPATERAVRIGRTVAIIGAFAGIMTGHFVVPFIAVYVWLMGQRELLTMRAKKLGGGFSFANFGGAGGSPSGDPGASQGSPFESRQGTPEDIPHEERGNEPQRPQSSEPQPDARRGDGFSDEDIRKLEGFHGRLQRGWQDSE